MKVTDYLSKQNVAYELVPHTETHDAQRLAATIHVPGREVAKTVLLKKSGGNAYVVAVLPANKAVDIEQASRVAGDCVLEMASEAEIAQQCPDCELGALPPFGSQYRMKTIVDENLSKDEEIVFEGNTHHEAIRMKFDEFCNIEQPTIGRFTVDL